MHLSLFLCRDFLRDQPGRVLRVSGTRPAPAGAEPRRAYMSGYLTDNGQ